MAGDENSVADDKATTQKAQGKFADFREFLYNKNNKDGKARVLGRTGRSWLEITIFYIIFYSCLAGFFAINLAIFLSTLKDTEPRYFGKGTIIGINPGLGYQPWIKAVAESTLISFNSSNSSYKEYVKALDVVWERYKKNGTEVRECTNASESNKQNLKEACMFNLTQFEIEGCGPDTHYGFLHGTPCVILTLNKLINWEPVRYPADSLPDALPFKLRNSSNYNGDVAVVCDGEFEADKENLGPVEYIPLSGIDKRYFPYKYWGDERYQQPFAMVKFTGLKVGILVEVECKAYAYNILHDRTNRLGMVHFELYRKPDS